MTRWILPIALLVLLAAVLTVGASCMHMGCAHSDHQPTSQPAAGAYTCPMHPQVRQAHPGKCPTCGMALVPAK